MSTLKMARTVLGLLVRAARDRIEGQLIAAAFNFTAKQIGEADQESAVGPALHILLAHHSAVELRNHMLETRSKCQKWLSKDANTLFDRIEAAVAEHLPAVN